MAKIKAVWLHIKRLWALYDYLANLEKEVGLLRNRVNELTTVHADINPYTDDIVIVVGRYRNSDYVRVFTLPEQSISSVIERLHEMEKYAKVGRFDIYPHIDIRAFYDRERF
jgi:hypothetical protein